jgi:hypothetical protein
MEKIVKKMKKIVEKYDYNIDPSQTDRFLAFSDCQLLCEGILESIL